MKISIPNLAVYASILLGILNVSCSKKDVVTDIDQTAALRNVSITYDSTTYQLGLPAGALSGKSFADLKAQDPTTYTNPQNYSIALVIHLLANNKTANAADAKFDGMSLNIVMDTIVSSPVIASAPAFVVLKNTNLPVPVSSSINLKTQRAAGLYIFKQIVAGSDLSTTQTPVFNYSFGVLQGTIPLPSFHENIPTRVDDGTKAFLKGLLDSGIFNTK
jgi:hypothetical protein